MNGAIFNLALKSLGNRLFTVGLTVLAIAMSVTLFLAVDKIRTGARTSFSTTISGTDLIVGARSGSINLLLYSVFRIGDPTGAMSWESYERIAGAPGVEWAVPISLGDSHRGYRVVGTNNDYFERYRYGRDLPLAFRAGEAFGANEKGVVIGAQVASDLGYEIGTEISLSHGIGEVSFADHDEHPMLVTGILRPTGTPVDRSVHVTLEAIERIHDDVVEEDGHDEEHAYEPEQITAVFIGMEQPTLVLRLQRQVNTYPDEALSAIIPGVALMQLWEVVGAGEAAFGAISAFVILVGLISIATSLSASLNERRREMAILRAVGARPGHVFVLLVSEATAIAAAGAIAGIVLINLLFVLIAGVVQSRYGLILASGGLSLTDMLTGVVVITSGAMMGILPARRALKNALADGLTVKL
ncbi:ABC transporter permease [Maricaulis sp. MIT060901]|uniref:ABC transporter permease n=1 Tax=Maricaulis sp. MIT060901 TaxID=3096993 RepID=UPI00399A00B6